MKVSSDVIEKRSREVEAIYGLANTINTGIDRRVIALLLEMMEQGIHSESLSDCKLII